MLVTRSFLSEGGWVYVASALVSVVLMLLRALGQARAGNAAAALLGCTFLVGSWFTANASAALNAPPWLAGEPTQRVLYERCVAQGGTACHVQYRTMDYFLEHRLLGVCVPLACGAALGLVMILTRRGEADEQEPAR